MKKLYLKYAVLICIIVIVVVYVIFHTNSASPAEAYGKDPIHDTFAGKLYGDVVQELTTIPASEDEVVWVAVVGGNRIAGGSAESFEAVVFYLMEKDGEKYRLGNEYMLYDLEEFLHPEDNANTFYPLRLNDGRKVYFNLLPSSAAETKNERYTYVDVKISTDLHAVDAVLVYYID